MMRPDFREIKHSNELYHYGIKRRSGRYPWGSGERPYQNVKDRIPKPALEYDPPYSSKEVLEKYGERIYNFLKNDPIHKYRMETGIELIHKEPTKEELIRICKNWQAMPDNLKKESEVKSQELFGMSNIDHFLQLIDSEYNDLKHSFQSEVKFKMNDFYYLSHGGPGSGRYPLGSGERPYQKFEGTGKKPSGILGYIRSRREKKAEEKEQKVKNEELRRLMQEEQSKRQRDSDKDRVLRSGTATEVMRYQGELTNQELQNVVTRLNLESQLRSLSERETKSAMDKVDKIMKTVKTGTEWAKLGTDTYNTFAAIYNATPDGQKKPLNLIRKGDSGERKKDGGDKKKD